MGKIIGKTRTNQPVEKTDGFDDSVKETIGDIENYGDLVKEFDSDIATIEGITTTASFCKVVRNFNELQFIFSCRLSNETAEDVLIANDTSLVNFGSLNDELLSRIYGHNGKNLIETPANITIAVAPMMINETNGLMAYSGSTQKYISLYYVKSGKLIRGYLEGGNITIPANHTYDFEARISLAL